MARLEHRTGYPTYCGRRSSRCAGRPRPSLLGLLRRPGNLFGALVLVASLLLPAAAPAQAGTGLRDVMHARNYAMGGAYRAHGLGAEAIAGNPAALPLYRRYQLELTGAWDAQTKFGFGSLAIADSATSEIAAGVSYDYVSLGRGEERRTVHLNTLALAVPLGGSFFLGASGRHVLMPGRANAVTMDAGLLIRPVPSLAIAASGHNLIDIHNPDVTRYFQLGSAFLGNLFTAAFDVRADFQDEEAPQLSYGAGLEYVTGNAFPVRGGYSYSAVTRTHFLSGGLGLITEGGGMDLAYRHELGGAGSRMLALTIKVQVQ